AALAELRGAALRVRAGLADRRRARRAALLPVPVVRVEVLPARIAVPGEREVPAGLAAPLHLLPAEPPPHPAGPRLRPGRGVPAEPEPAEAGPGGRDGPVRRPRRADRADRAGRRRRPRAAPPPVGAGAGPARQARPAPRRRDGPLPGRLRAHRPRRRRPRT